ncbi:threonine synthase [Desulfovibrionales bacterium]
MIGPHSFPDYRGVLEYRCLSCEARYGIDELLYTCPVCDGVFLIEDTTFERLAETSGRAWRERFDTRAAWKHPAFRGIFRYYELIAPVIEMDDIVCLGEGHTHIVAASPALQRKIGQPFAFKNDGQNPSASFKDRGMACVFSYIKFMIRRHRWNQMLTVCASTGDTSASAALYAAYVGWPIKSIVLLPQGKVTPQQLAQTLGSGATVLEVPGVFDDCMEVVEHLADRYRVALLNSKNAWRILGQESYVYEVAQWYDWNLTNKSLFVPIGNAGNITAIMSGLLKLHVLGVIEGLPRIFGVQSHHADPVFQYYAEPDPKRRKYQAVPVRPSVAQAAMIGNPVSFPRVKHFSERYMHAAGPDAFQIVKVTEQAIIEGMLLANRHGHTACTQGGECLAGLIAVREQGRISQDELAVLDATAHSLKFIKFQDMYFADNFPSEYEIHVRPELSNAPQLIIAPEERERLDQPAYVRVVAETVAQLLNLERRS